MGHPGDRRYTNEHEWAKAEGAEVVVGITRHATDSLGDIVFVELPKVGAQVTKGQAFGVVESTKAVSELFAPVSGRVAAVNDALPGAPETVNADPHGAGWMVRIAPSAPAELDALLDAAKYEAFLAEAAH